MVVLKIRDQVRDHRGERVSKFKLQWAVLTVASSPKFINRQRNVLRLSSKRKRFP